MIITEQKREFDSQLPGETRNFGMKITGRAFRLLSKDLYQDPIQAIVRELTTNATDSHKAAGTPDKRVRLHLPSQLEPYFEVQDWGVGLDDAGLSIFVTYFDSTKTMTNEQTGALGLGSKSPFAYTGTFDVVTVKDNRRISTTCFLKEDESPSMTVWSNEPSFEPNGVTIRVPVNTKEDFSKFHRAAQFQELFMEVKPIIEGEFTPYDFTPLMTGPDWKLYSYIDMNKLPSTGYVVQGDVPYKISSPLRGLVVTVPIGTLDFAMNRENLQHTPETTARLSSLLERVTREIKDQKRKLFVKGSFWQHSELWRKEDMQSLFSGDKIEYKGPDGETYVIGQTIFRLKSEDYTRFKWDAGERSLRLYTEYSNSKYSTDFAWNSSYSKKDFSVAITLPTSEIKFMSFRNKLREFFKKRYPMKSVLVLLLKASKMPVALDILGYQQVISGDELLKIRTKKRVINDPADEHTIKTTTRSISSSNHPVYSTSSQVFEILPRETTYVIIKGPKRLVQTFGGEVPWEIFKLEHLEFFLKHCNEPKILQELPTIVLVNKTTSGKRWFRNKNLSSLVSLVETGIKTYVKKNQKKINQALVEVAARDQRELLRHDPNLRRLVNALNQYSVCNKDPALVPENLSKIHREWTSVQNIVRTPVDELRSDLLIKWKLVKPLKNINERSELHQSILDLISRGLLNECLDSYGEYRAVLLEELFTLWKIRDANSKREGE